MIHVDGAAGALQRHQANTHRALDGFGTILGGTAFEEAGEGAIDDLEGGDANTVANDLDLRRLVGRADRHDLRNALAAHLSKGNQAAAITERHDGALLAGVAGGVEHARAADRAAAPGPRLITIGTVIGERLGTELLGEPFAGAQRRRNGGGTLCLALALVGIRLGDVGWHGRSIPTAEGGNPYASRVTGSMKALLLGTLTLRTATGTTGALLIVWNKYLNSTGSVTITPVDLATITLAFYVTELIGSPIFGIIADRIGRKPVMLLGPLFGLAAVIMTPFSMTIPLLIGTRLLEGASTAASVPSILSYVAAKTSHDAALRGRVVTLFEVATLGGLLVAGTALAGPLWAIFGPAAFAVNGAIYVLALLFFAYGVKDEHAAPPPQTENRLRKYLKLFSQRGILLFVPTWVSINAIIGVWVPQGLNLLLGDETVNLSGQFLLSGFPFVIVTSAFAFVALIGGVGLFFWGNRFANFRRTTMLLLGLIAFVVAMAAIFAINRLSGNELPLIALLFAVLCGSMFFIAGATPAALGFLADVSERYHTDRSAVMGLYSIFLGLGQVIGVKLAGDLAATFGVDGLVYATLGFLVVAGTFLLILRRVEHEILLPSAPGQQRAHG